MVGHPPGPGDGPPRRMPGGKAAGGQLVHTFKQHNGVGRVAFNAAGDRLITTGLEGTAKVWDTKTWGHVYHLRGHTQGVTALACTPAGVPPLIATGGWDANVIV